MHSITVDTPNFMNIAFFCGMISGTFATFSLVTTVEGCMSKSKTMKTLSRRGNVLLSKVSDSSNINTFRNFFFKFKFNLSQCLPIFSLETIDVNSIRYFSPDFITANFGVNFYHSPFFLFFTSWNDNFNRFILDSSNLKKAVIVFFTAKFDEVTSVFDRLNLLKVLKMIFFKSCSHLDDCSEFFFYLKSHSS